MQLVRMHRGWGQLAFGGVVITERGQLAFGSVVIAERGPDSQGCTVHTILYRVHVHCTWLSQ